MRWWRRAKQDNDLDRELRSHLDLEAEEATESGASPDEARSQPDACSAMLRA